MFRCFWMLSSLAISVGAANYYLDPGSGNDLAAGTSPAVAWKSMARASLVKWSPGDSLLLKRGGVWQPDSLFLEAVGTRERPIVVSDYGEPAASPPHVSNRGNLLVLRKSSHVVVRNLVLSGARGGCIEMRDSSVSHIVVESIEAFDCGGGVHMSGNDIVVRDSYIHDGHMVVNTPDVMDDDYGASGIGFSRLDGCLVTGNRLVNLRAPSYDYGFDGGALESWKTVRNCDIFGNFAYRTNGFAEFGGQKGDSVVNVAIHHNVLLETGLLACFHVRDSATLFGVGYDRVRLDNNLSVTRHGPVTGFHVVADGARLSDKNRIKIRNNIFVDDSANYYHYQQYGSSDAPDWTHEYNLLWSPKTDPFKNGRVAGAGEIFANPQFANLKWNETDATDTALASYALLEGSPAVGSGIALGYPVDFFGQPAEPNGKVDRGPFATGTGNVGVRKAARSNRGERPMIAWTNGTELRVGLSAADAPISVHGSLVSRNGRLLEDLGTWRAVPGAPKAFVLSKQLKFGAILVARLDGGVVHCVHVPVLP